MSDPALPDGDVHCITCCDEEIPMTVVNADRECLAHCRDDAQRRPTLEIDSSIRWLWATRCLSMPASRDRRTGGAA